MSSRMQITRATGSYWNNVKRLRETLNAADAVVLGAGAGLSAAAGFVYGGERFERYFSDFGAKYGFEDMYTGGFYPFPSQEERWAAFGWHVLSVDGNSIDALDEAFETAKTVKGKPTVIISNSTKGYGSPVMENKAAWHHKVPTAAEYEQIKADFLKGKEAAQNG